MTITIPTNLKTIDFEAHEKAEAFISKRMDFDNFLVEKAKQTANTTLIEDIDIQAFEKKVILKNPPHPNYNNINTLTDGFIEGADGF
jgi:uncharacterized protein (DUF1919 family)